MTTGLAPTSPVPARARGRHGERVSGAPPALAAEASPEPSVGFGERTVPEWHDGRSPIVFGIAVSHEPAPDFDCFELRNRALFMRFVEPGIALERERCGRGSESEPAAIVGFGATLRGPRLVALLRSARRHR